MQGHSRHSLTVLREGLDAAVGAAGDPAVLATELFAIADLIGREGSLRRTLADPARLGSDRSALMNELMAGKVSAATAALASAVVGSRWSRPLDVVTALETLGEESLLIAAQNAGTLETVEDELFRFSRTVARESALALAFSDPNLPASQKAAMVHSLLDGKATEQAIALIERVVTRRRDLPVARVLQEIVEAAALRRERRVATVTSAVALTSEQVGRLGSALSTSYGVPIQVQVEVDPSIVGGVIVKVGDQLIDGSVTRRLDTAARALVR